MRRTLGLVLALPATLLLLGSVASPSGPRPPAAAPAAAQDTQAHEPATSRIPPARDPSPTGSRTPSLTVPAPPAGEVGEVDPTATASEASGTTSDSSSPADSGVGVNDPELSDEGFLIAAVPDAGGVAGTGPRWRYTIEIDPETGLDPEDVARQVRAALTDERSWVRERTLEQVAEPSRARIRIVIATPQTVDALCARAGLRTVGIYSCWNGRVAALNAWRWEVGADGFEDIATYRTYLINHEVGHGFGYGHVGCPTPGSLAPVMMQQSKGLDGCVANGWPYP